MTRRALLLLLLASGCSSILGFKDPSQRGDGGVPTDGSGSGSSIAPTLSTFEGMTTVGPDNAGSGHFAILDPRFEGQETVCAGSFCLAGGLTP